LTISPDDFGAIGAVTDKILADREFQALFASLGTSASPISGGTNGSYWVDVPL
jgi:hypothetical protein